MKSPRVIFVTGKGGTGKSTIADALSAAIARDRAAALIDLIATDSPIESADPSRGNLDHVALDARSELVHFIERIVPIKMVARRMIQSRTFGFVTVALPGLEAFLMLDRLRLLSDGAGDKTLIVDAPSTGEALEMLRVPAAIKRLAPFGTLHQMAADLETFLCDRNRFGVLIVTTPEDLPLREALDLSKSLKQLGIRSLGAVLNFVAQPLFTPAELKKIDLPVSHQRLAEQRLARTQQAARARSSLKRAAIDFSEIPIIYRGITDHPQSDQLADAIAQASLCR